MSRILMSPAAAGLLRALLARAGTERDRILLTQVRSIDWQSLTFVGERHEFELRIAGPDPAALAGRIAGGLSDHDFQVRGHVVADIALIGAPAANADGSVSIAIEALTLVQD